MREKNLGILSKLILLFVVGVGLMACKPKAVDEEVSAPEVVELEKDFVEFYNQFHADTLFQLENIQFPLKRSEQDSIDTPWNENNWIIHQPFSDYGGKFDRNFSVMGKLVIEKINDANGFFSMERRFAKLHDGWKLIYYNVERQSAF